MVRVHPEILARQKLPKKRRDKIWDRRYREINDWEHYLIDNGFMVVKLFLNLSKEEQRIRFLKRLDSRRGTGSSRPRRPGTPPLGRLPGGVLPDALGHQHEHAPWYVIPADHKWFARICAGAVIAHTLIEIDPQYPR